MCASKSAPDGQPTSELTGGAWQPGHGERTPARSIGTSFSLPNIRKLVAKRVRDFGGDFLRLGLADEYRWVSVRVLFDESLAPDEVVLCFREVEEEKQRQLQERKLLEDALESARQQRKDQAGLLQQHVPRYAHSSQCHHRPDRAGAAECRRTRKR